MTPLQVAKPIVLDLLAAIAFAAAFFVAKNGLQISGLHSVYIATGAGIGIGLVQLVAKDARPRADRAAAVAEPGRGPGARPP